MQHAIPLSPESVTTEAMTEANLKRLTKAELKEISESTVISYEFYCLVRRELEGRTTKVKGSG